MKLPTSLSVLAVCLYVVLPSRSTAQECDADSQIGSDSNKLLAALQASPSDECRNQMLALVQVTDFVAQAQTVFSALVVVCEPTCLEYVRNFAENCRPSDVVLLGHACARNEHQRLCYQTVLTNNGTSVLMQCYPELFQPGLPVEMSQTSTTTPMPELSSCPNACRGALETFRGLHGCCVTNAFNSTTFGLQSLGLADYSLWSMCGVETIDGFCPLPFNTTSDVTTAQVDGDMTTVGGGVTNTIGDDTSTSTTEETDVSMTTVVMTTLPTLLDTDSSLPFTAHSWLTLFSLLTAFLVLF